MKNASVIRKALFLIFVTIFLSANGWAATHFYRENRNGKAFILQVDPDTGLETVFNHEKTLLFTAPGATRVAALPTAGWGDSVTNKKPTGESWATSERTGDLNGILTLRPSASGAGVAYKIYRGTGTLLTTITDSSRTTLPTFYDLAVSQFMGINKNIIRVYLFVSDYQNKGPVLFRTVFNGGAVDSSMTGYKSESGAYDNWTSGWATLSGTMSGAQSINVNAISDTADLVLFHPSRSYSLQGVWKADAGGNWGINYLLDTNIVYKGNSTNPLTNVKTGMSQIFDVAVDLGNANADTLQYYRSYYNHGLTFVQNNVNTNNTITNLYGEFADPAGKIVEIRDGSPTGTVMGTIGVNPNPTIIGHGAVGLYGLACQNALTGTELVVYEPVYKINQAAVDAGEISDTNRNNIPDHIDNDGLGDFGYRTAFLIDRNNGGGLHTDYVLDYVIAHRFSLSGKSANNEFTYREYALKRTPNVVSTVPSALIQGEVVHVRVGNTYHRDPDTYGEYNQFGWDASGGNGLFIWVGNNGEAYNTQNNSAYPNSGKILGVEVKNTSYATADFFSVVGNDEWAAGQGDLYFLARKYGTYNSPSVIAANNSLTPPVTGYGLWWKFQYSRSTSYGISRTYWIGASPFSEWMNSNGFFIGNSVFSQMVYNVNCGCRGQRYDNFQKMSEASSPINDFALVNIGAPPYNKGVIFPTIQANNGEATIQPNTPVKFTGSFKDPVNLLSSGTVKYQYVILKNQFNDTDPIAVGNALATNSGLIDSMNWNYVFNDDIMKDSNGNPLSVATFNVYLGIQYDYQDYESMDYPYFSWWSIPVTTGFAWSNSKAGVYHDGMEHGTLPALYGAPIQVVVSSKNTLTATQPLVITKVDAQTENIINGSTVTTTWANDVVTVQQKNEGRVKIRFSGKMMFLSDIPAPADTFKDRYASCGGILPYVESTNNGENHTRYYMTSAGSQYDGAKANIAVTETQMMKDFEKVLYQVFIKAKTFTKDGSGVVSYTETDPTVPAQSYLYDNANLSTIKDYMLLASGNLGTKGTVSTKITFDSNNASDLKVSYTPAYDSAKPNMRIFDFNVELPWLRIPSPLDAGLAASDDRDKYEIRVGCKFPIGEWTRVIVKRGYNDTTVTDSYNASKIKDQTASSSNKVGEPTKLHLLVTDTKAPDISDFVLPAQAFSGENFPGSQKTITLTDGNPNDYVKRAKTVPSISYTYSIGKDHNLRLTGSDQEKNLLIDFSNRQTSGYYTYKAGTSGVLNIQTGSPDSYAYLTTPVSLSSYTVGIATFPNERNIVYQPTSAGLISSNFLSTPLYNAQGYKMQFNLSDGVMSFSGSTPVIKDIVDGSGNASKATPSGTVTIWDNDPPNLRVILNDQMNLDAMIEVTRGIRDDYSGSTLSPRHLKVTNITSNSIAFEGDIATTTSNQMAALLTETYRLGFLTPTPANFTVTTPVDSNVIPFQVQTDARFRVVADAYDNGSDGKLPVVLAINETNLNLTGTNELNYIFHRGLGGQVFTLRATTTDAGGNAVVVEIPLSINNAGNLSVRTLQESLRKEGK